ncbi:hypothetical protein V6N13_116037 [Hibiscus sabdariffa]
MQWKARYLYLLGDNFGGGKLDARAEVVVFKVFAGAGTSVACGVIVGWSGGGLKNVWRLLWMSSNCLLVHSPNTPIEASLVAAIVRVPPSGGFAGASSSNTIRLGIFQQSSFIKMET